MRLSLSSLYIWCSECKGLERMEEDDTRASYLGLGTVLRCRSCQRILGQVIRLPRKPSTKAQA